MHANSDNFVYIIISWQRITASLSFHTHIMYTYIVDWEKGIDTGNMEQVLTHTCITYSCTIMLIMEPEQCL